MANMPAVVSDGLAAVATRETASVAAAVQAEAMVRAHFAMALQRPRNPDMVRARLLRECERKAFAECATYTLPRGGAQITGPSIRFAEAALRALGNVMVQTSTIYDDDAKRIVRVQVTDLEVNYPDFRDIVITKTMERRSLKKGQVAISERVNSLGEKVYLVEATDDELLMRENAQTSRAIRTLAIRLLPGDLIDEALAACDRTLARDDSADPERTRKAMLDAFIAVGVSPADLATFLGHDTTALSPAEVRLLRGAYNALKTGEVTWQEILDERLAAEATDHQAATPDGDERARRKIVLEQLAQMRLRVQPAAWAAAFERAGIDPKIDWQAKCQITVLEQLAASLAAAHADGSAKEGGRQ